MVLERAAPLDALRRFSLCRLAAVPVLLLLANAFGYLYASLAQWARAADASSFSAFLKEAIAAYWVYLQGVARLDFGILPHGRGPTSEAVLSVLPNSLGLLALAFLISSVLGLVLGLQSARTNPPSVNPWLTPVSTLGMAMPSFYVGTLSFTLLIFFILRGWPRPSLPFFGTGWDRHLVLPLVALCLRPTAQIALISARLLADQLRKPGSGRVAWRFEVEAGFAGGPAVAADGTLYVGGNDARLYAASEGGEERWQAELGALPVGAPALDADGTIYVADAEGERAFSPEGELLWREGGAGSTVATPIVAPDGTIFYATERHVRAIGPDGTLRWESEWLPGAAPEAALMLDPSGTWLFAGQSVLQASDGQAVPNLNLQTKRYLVGADGTLYFQPRAKALVRWEMNENGYPAVLERVAWRDNSGGTALPPAIGVAPDGHLWYQANLESQFRLAWLTPTGRASGLYSTMLRNARLVGLDRFGTAFACGQRGNLSLICVAVPANGTREAWHLDLPSSGQVMGGALAPSRLYVATEGGVLYAIEGQGRGG